MKNHIYIILVIILTLCACKQSVKSTVNEPDDIKINKSAVVTAEILVTGMTCGGCENTISLAINEISGIESVSASHSDSLATVRYDTTLADISQIMKSIDEVGYQAVSFKILE